MVTSCGLSAVATSLAVIVSPVMTTERSTSRATVASPIFIDCCSGRMCLPSRSMSAPSECHPAGTRMPTVRRKPAAAWRFMRGLRRARFAYSAHMDEPGASAERMHADVIRKCLEALGNPDVLAYRRRDPDVAGRDGGCECERELDVLPEVVEAPALGEGHHRT